MKRIIRWIGYLLFIITVGLSVTLFMVCRWAKETFNVSIDAIINTLASPLKGTSSDTVIPAIKYCLPAVLLTIVFCIICIVLQCVKRTRIIPRLMVFLSLGAFIGALGYVQHVYDIVSYIRYSNQETTLYEEYYVDPLAVSIREPEEKRNLLYIYLESMETTYADIETGGNQDVNYMPYAAKLAQEYVSFSNTDKLGGLRPVIGATWTMGALFTSSSGLPFAFPVGVNGMELQELFATGVYALGDFLEDQGYNQEFLCGSDIAFAGRDLFYEQHGMYEVFDLFTAREMGYIPKDYFEFWGYEDYILYEIAKDELLRLDAEELPFNLTMLTVDAHHIGGNMCKYCEDEYEDVTANVITCADKQLNNFIEWCKEQDFFEDTTIVIVGDHPRMDTHLVEGVDYNERTLYNCFINASCELSGETTNREASQLDMYPTILAALGYEIDGDKLGLGANLFSEEATLLERFGLEEINREFSKNSLYYVERFSPELMYMVEDEKTAIQTIYFYGEEYNASEYVSEGLTEPEADGSWVEGKQMVVRVPVEEMVDKVRVTIHVVGSIRKEYYAIQQDGKEVCNGVAEQTDIISFDVNVKDGMCEFVLSVPHVESPYAYGMSTDTRAISLKLTHMTVNLCESEEE